MSLNLEIRIPREPVEMNFVLPAEVADDLKKYVEVARNAFPGVSDSEVIAAIMEGHMRRDRYFQEIRKRTNGERKRGRPGRIKSSAAEEAGVGAFS